MGMEGGWKEMTGTSVGCSLDTKLADDRSVSNSVKSEQTLNPSNCDRLALNEQVALSTNRTQPLDLFQVAMELLQQRHL